MECLRRPGLRNCWHSIGFCKVSKTKGDQTKIIPRFCLLWMHQRNSGIDLFGINNQRGWKSGTRKHCGYFSGETFWIFSNRCFSRFAFFLMFILLLYMYILHSVQYNITSYGVFNIQCSLFIVQLCSMIVVVVVWSD